MNIVFDLDGTLIDSAPDIHFVACSLLRELGREEISLDEARSFIGEGSGVFVSRMMAARGLASEPGLHAELLGRFVSGLEASVELASFYAGVPELLNELSSTGYMLGLCTNKPEGPTRALIRHMGIEASFSAVIAGGMLEHRKPAPDMLIECIRQLGDGPTLYVGDSEIDAQTAQAANIPFALFTQGYRKSALEDIPHRWAFETFAELPRIIDELSAEH